MNTKTALTIPSIILSLAIITVLILMFAPQLKLVTIQTACATCTRQDAIAIAAQVGRLDIVSLALTILGICVGFFVIFSFFAIKNDAKDASKEVAKQTINEILTTDNKALQSIVQTIVKDEIKEAGKNTLSIEPPNIVESDTEKLNPNEA